MSQDVLRLVLEFIGIRSSSNSNIFDTFLSFHVMSSTSQVPADGQGRSSRMRYPASPKDWEEQRGNFQELYVTQRKPLRVVVSEMKRLYGFEATYEHHWKPQQPPLI